LVYLNKNDLFRTFPNAQVEQLRAMSRNLDLDYIVNKIEIQYKNRKYLNDAVLNATGVNKHDFSGDRSGFIGVGSLKTINKLQPWLEKARKKETNNQQILHQLRKIKLLMKTEEIVDSGVKIDELHLHPSLGKIEARFFTSLTEQDKIITQAAVRNIDLDLKQITNRAPTDKSGESSPTYLKRLNLL
jgi:hypothetical protein